MTEPDYTLVDELDRKTLDAVANLLTELEQGTTSRDQALRAIAVLFQAVSGLVGGETFDLISQASKEIQGGLEAVVARRTFIRDEAIVVAEHQQGATFWSMKVAKLPSKRGEQIQWGVPLVSDFKDAGNPYAAAFEHFNQQCQALLDRDFVEIK